MKTRIIKTMPLLQKGQQLYSRSEFSQGSDAGVSSCNPLAKKGNGNGSLRPVVKRTGFEDAQRAHRRQFFFSNANLEIPKGWETTSLGDGFMLHHCPWLNVHTVTDESGQQWGLLGHAFDIQEDSYRAPIAAIGKSCTKDVPALVSTWSGRWVLISSSMVITDAAALLGIYVLENERGVFISSSLALLSQLFEKPIIRDKRILGWYGINWFPGPLSRLAGVNRLLPDQVYNPKSRSISYFKRLSPATGISLGEATEAMSRGLIQIFRAMASQDSMKSMILTLTGGLDSRTTFSVLHAAAIPFNTLTLGHPRISRADSVLPGKISKSYNIIHRHVNKVEQLGGRLDEYDLHTCRSVVDGDRLLYARGSYENLGPQNWLIRSACWELGRRYYHRKLHGLDLEELFEHPHRLMRRFRTYTGTKATEESLSEWARWRLDNPVAVPWQDLFYRDQRLGCWSSSIEQSLDLLDPVSIHPANCDRFYDIMLGLTDGSEWNATTLQEGIIAKCTPDLLDVPVNPPEGGYLAMKTYMLKIAAIMCGETLNLLGTS